MRRRQQEAREAVFLSRVTWKKPQLPGNSRRSSTRSCVTRLSIIPSGGCRKPPHPPHPRAEGRSMRRCDGGGRRVHNAAGVCIFQRANRYASFSPLQRLRKEREENVRRRRRTRDASVSFTRILAGAGLTSGSKPSEEEREGRRRKNYFLPLFLKELTLFFCFLSSVCLLFY